MAAKIAPLLTPLGATLLPPLVADPVGRPFSVGSNELRSLELGGDTKGTTGSSLAITAMTNEVGDRIPFDLNEKTFAAARSNTFHSICPSLAL